jgi:1,4-dihydroxy-2-naphthoate octaprenyltransferase
VVTLWGVVRLPFLLLTPACLAPAIAAAYAVEGSLSVLITLGVVLAAIAAHVAVNSHNEIADFKSGLDFHTVKTPFSGGSGTLVVRPDWLPAARWIAWLSTGLSAAVGGLLVFFSDGVLFGFGLLGMALVLAYSSVLHRYPWGVWAAPGLGFGPVMVLGTQWALVGSLSAEGVLAAVVCFFLVNNLLLVNQLPDQEADTAHGRRNVVTCYGPGAAALLYRVDLYFVYGALAFGYWVLQGSAGLLWGLVTLPLAWTIAQGLRSAKTPEALLPLLGRNVLLTLLTPCLLAAGLFVHGTP